MARWLVATLEWDIDWEGERVASEIRAGTELALASGAQQLLDAAIEDTPVRTGALRESGEVIINGPVAQVMFGHRGASKDRNRHTKHYAVPNHKREDYEHPRGGVHHYLERNVFPGRRTFDAMADVLRAVHEA